MHVGKALEQLGGWTAGEHQWRHLLGDEYEDLRPLLMPEPELAAVIRLPGQLEPLQVVSHNDEDHVAIDPDEPEPIPVSRNDLLLWTLPCERILEQAMEAAPLAGRLHKIPDAKTVWRTGELRRDGRKIPAYASLAMTPRSIASDIAHIRQLASGVFIVMTLLDDLPPLSVQIIQSKAAAWVRMDEAFSWQSPGMLWCRDPFTEHLPDSMRQRASSADRSSDRVSMPVPKGTRWPDVQMRIAGADAITVFIDGASEQLTPKRLGLQDKRNGKPKEAWGELGLLISHRGSLQVPVVTAPKRQRQFGILGSTLSAHFRIPGKPIQWNRGQVTAQFRCLPLQDDSD